MVRRFFRKHHNRILRSQAWVNGILCVLSICSIDGEGYTAYIVCMGTLLWLCLFAYANGYFIGG